MISKGKRVCGLAVVSLSLYLVNCSAVSLALFKDIAVFMTWCTTPLLVSTVFKAVNVRMECCVIHISCIRSFDLNVQVLQMRGKWDL